MLLEVQKHQLVYPLSFILHLYFDHFRFPVDDLFGCLVPMIVHNVEESEFRKKVPGCLFLTVLDRIVLSQSSISLRRKVDLLIQKSVELLIVCNLEALFLLGKRLCKSEYLRLYMSEILRYVLSKS